MRGTEIGLLIFRLLKDIPGIDGRVFPIKAELGCEAPFIVYERQSLTPSYSKDGLYEESVVTGIDVVCNDYEQSVNIAGKVRDLLDDYRDSDIDRTRFAASSEMFVDDNSFVQHLEYIFDVKIK